MSLGDFFRNNLPYGMAKNDKGQWQAYNREYMPLGFNKTMGEFGLHEENQLPIQSKYHGLTDGFILKLVDGPERIERNERGEIIRFWLYNDGTNPMNRSGKETTILWKRYFEKLEKLGRLKEKIEI